MNIRLQMQPYNKAPKYAFARRATAGRFNLRFQRPLARRYALQNFYVDAT
jgi:hypothetical protein